MAENLGPTGLIRSVVRMRIERDGLRKTARTLGIDHARLTRFANGERELTTGDDLDHVIDLLGISVSYTGRPRKQRQSLHSSSATSSASWST